MLGQELVRVFSAEGRSASGGRNDKDYKVFDWDKKEIDITKEKEVKNKIEKIKPDIIINAAAYNAVDEAEKKLEYKKARLINGKASGYLAKIAKKIGAIFIYYSTDYVFDGNPEIKIEPAGCNHICATCQLHKKFTPLIGYAENAKPKPISNYGKTKLMGEKKLLKVKGKYYLIRLSRLFGKPAKTKNAKKSFFDLMLDFWGGNKKVHPVKSARSGSAKQKFNRVKVINDETSCFTYAPDAAKKTKEIIESKKPYGIYHVFNEGPCTWYEAVVELYKQAKISTRVIPVKSSEFPRPAKRPFYSALLNTKLNPLRNYQGALKDYLKKL